MSELYSRGPAVFTVTLVMLIIATTFTVFRLISKWGILKKSTADDWLVIIAWMFACAMCISVMVGTSVGLGKQDADIVERWREPLKRSIYAFTIFYNPALMAIKSAILLLYIRMSTAHPFLRYASLFVLAIVNLAGFVLTFLNIFQCRPVSAAFTEESGRCIDLVNLYLSSAPITVLTDVAILLLPLPILTALRMEFRQKVVLVLTFIVGGFSTIVDVVRLVYLQNALEHERQETSTSDISATQRPPNFTYEASFLLMWSCVEVCTGLVCACALVLKPLVLKVVPAMIHHSTGSRHRGSEAGQGTAGVEAASKLPRSPVQRMDPVFEEPESVDEAGSAPNGQDGNDDDGAMDFMQMLSASAPMEPSSPVMGNSTLPAITPAPGSAPRRSSRRHTLLPGSIFPQHKAEEEQVVQQQPTQIFFDFVNMTGKKPLTELSAREAWSPILFVSILFFMWGFAYGLLGTLNAQIQSLLRYSPAKTIALHSAYWIGYPFGSLLIGYWTITRSSFKSTFMAGLCVYAIGAMAFWPSSVLLSYAGFFISNFIIALGLSTLEIAANPFIALAGPSHLSESRLLFSQGIQAVGSVLSPILAKEALFVGLSQTSLFNVQWCYLAVSLFVIALAVVFYYVPLPEATDDELETLAQQTLLDAGLEANASLIVFRRAISARKILMSLGVFMIAAYCGGQEIISYFWTPLVSTMQPTADPFWQQSITHALFAIGRFLASFACYLGVRPRYILLAALVGAFVCTLLALVLPVGTAPLSFLQLAVFFESPIFPIVFATSLRGQGKYTKLAGCLLITGAGGAAGFPGVAYGAQAAHRGNSRFSLVVAVVLWACMLVMPIWLCGGMRTWVDPLRPYRVGSGEEGVDGRRTSVTSSGGIGSSTSTGKEERTHVEVSSATR